MRDVGVAVLAGGLVFALTTGVAQWPIDREIRLHDFGNTLYSQAGEDGILQKIFEVIEPTSHFAIEFGAGDGIEFSNVANLIIHRGWRGLLIEGDAKKAETLRERYLGFPGVRGVQAWVFPANVESLFEENNVPRDLDLLVIDIDSNDYYVWRAIRDYRPKVVMIEYNGRFAPPLKMVIGFHPMMYWDEVGFHNGASIQSLYELGERKGYKLIGTNHRGINLFFVEQQYFPRFRIDDNSPARLYQPLLGVAKHMDGRSSTFAHFSSAFDNEAIRKTGLPQDPDLVLSETTIRKRFRFDR